MFLCELVSFFNISIFFSKSLQITIYFVSAHLSVLFQWQTKMVDPVYPSLLYRFYISLHISFSSLYSWNTARWTLRNNQSYIWWFNVSVWEYSLHVKFIITTKHNIVTTGKIHVNKECMKSKNTINTIW